MIPTLHAEQLRHVSPWLYKTAAQVWIDYDFPRHLFVETTAACNLMCAYCPRERRGNHMDYRLFTQIVEEARHYGRRSFSLHLFGEPLLYPKIIEAILALKTDHHTVLLTTNGTYLNAFVDDLLRVGVDKIIWTWRPEAQFTSDTKEKLRQWGHFMVRLIEEITPADALKEWGTWQPQERKRLHNYGGNIDIVQWKKSSDFQDTITTIPLTTRKNSNVNKRWPCYHLWLAPAVAWNGSLLICCADPMQKEVLGQFPQMSIHQAWASPQLAAIRQSHLTGNYGGICAGCDSWKTYPDLFFEWQKNFFFRG